jgi:hypothetical protein
MYSSFHGVWRGFQKNFFPAFRREASFWSFIAFHFTVFLLPFVLLIAMPGSRVAGAVPTVILMRAVLALRFRQNLWSLLFHPVAESVLIGIGLLSWRRCKNGEGVEWRGRRYHHKGGLAG